MADINDDHPDRSYAVVPAGHGSQFSVMLLGGAGEPSVQVSTHDTQQQAEAEVTRLIAGGLADST